MSNGSGSTVYSARAKPRRTRAIEQKGTLRHVPVSDQFGGAIDVNTAQTQPRQTQAVVGVEPVQCVPASDQNGSMKDMLAIVTETHRKRAKGSDGTENPQPASPNIQIGAEATSYVTAGITQPPSPTPNSGHASRDYRYRPAAEDEGANVPHRAESIEPPHPASYPLQRLQRIRRFAIVSQSRSDRACESFISTAMGFTIDAEEKTRKEIYARAQRLRKEIEKGGAGIKNTSATSPPSTQPDGQAGQDAIATDDPAIRAVCYPIVMQTYESRKGWDRMRESVEKEMRKLAETLPVWEWSKGVRGLGALGVAIIAAETTSAFGDLGSYPTKERVWKRCGLAVIDGDRQKRVADAEAAKAHGYNPKRRAEIWTIADSMFRHQWAGAKDGAAAHPTGPYGEVYMRRKSHTSERDWNGGRKEADARRVMTKALLEDYWRVWRGMPPLAGKGEVP